MAGSLTLVSYNMHGFNQGKPMLSELCLNSDIICVQEHWLLPSNLNCFNEFNSHFIGFSSSAMDSVAGRGILRGRPFGGVGVLVNRCHAHKVKCLATAERFLILSVHNVIIINVYLPVCKEQNGYINDMSDIFSGISYVLDQYPDYSVIVAGDFNCDIVSDNIGCKLVAQFMVEHRLACCDKWCNKDIKYTYCHASLDSRSFIDHFLVSNSICSQVEGCEVVDSGVNLSDHLPIILNISITVPDTAANADKPPDRQAYRPCRLRWDKADLGQYCADTLLNLGHFNNVCDINRIINGECVNKSMIDDLYRFIVESLTMSANSSVPRTSNNYFKHWWDDNLRDLKAKSIDAHALWKSCGCPRDGDVYHLKRSAKAEYKLALRQKNRDDIDYVSNELHDMLLQKEQSAFWKTWSAKFCKKVKPSEFIDGCNDSSQIANTFAAVFARACTNNSIEASVKLYNEYELCKQEYVKVSTSEDTAMIDIELINKSISCLKRGKAAGLDGIEAEHLVYAHPIAQYLLLLLFNSILFHGYVPQEFGSGIIIPIVKDKSGDTTSSANYRGITLSSNIAKLFEMCILDMYGSYLLSSDLQYGFKKNSSCSSAIYTVRSVIEYFTKHGSTVNVCLLDMSKAFDKVNHHGLYIKLMKRNVPIRFINVITNWYSKCYAAVRWNGCFSQVFDVCCGVRQGGVLSPVLFAIYVDDIIVDLKTSQEGCCIDGLYLGCVMYADDLLLLSASLTTLQRMINICAIAAGHLDIAFNVQKSMVVRVGHAYKHVCVNVTLNGLALPFVDKAKYLGVFITAGRHFKVSVSEPINKFYKAVNGILYKCKGRMNDVVILHLFNSYCKPLLCYACECVDMLKSDYRRLINAWNSIYWKLFNVSDSNCLNDIIRFTGYIPISLEIDIRKYSFLYKLQISDNAVLRDLYKLFGEQEIVDLAAEYNMTFCSGGKFKSLMRDRFLLSS